MTIADTLADLAGHDTQGESLRGRAEALRDCAAELRTYLDAATTWTPLDAAPATPAPLAGFIPSAGRRRGHARRVCSPSQTSATSVPSC